MNTRKILKLDWVEVQPGYWAANTLRVSRYGKIYNAYRIVNSDVEHITSNGRIKNFRNPTNAALEAETKWGKEI